jgi:hypothetical protein
MYVDRIIARRDKTRLDDDRVREAVRTALGAFTDLAPELASTCSVGFSPHEPKRYEIHVG